MELESINIDAPFYLRVFTYLSKDGNLKKILTWTLTNAKCVELINHYILFNLDSNTDMSRFRAPATQTWLDVSSINNNAKYTIKIIPKDQSTMVTPTKEIVQIFADDAYSSFNQNDPNWYQNLSLADKEKLNINDAYSNWRKVTTFLNKPLIDIYTDTPDHSNIKWRTDNRILFHGDEEFRPFKFGDGIQIGSRNFVIDGGLTPPEPMGSLKMKPGEHVGSLESFSYSFAVTFFFAREQEHFAYLPSPYKIQTKYIYLTNAPGGVDIDYSVHSPSEKEIAFPGGVLSKWILGAFVLDQTNAFLYYIKNPSCDTTIGEAPDGYVDIILSLDKPQWFLHFESIDTTPTSSFNVSGSSIRLKIQDKFKITVISNSASNPLPSYCYWYFNNHQVAENTLSTTLDLNTTIDLNKVLVICFSDVFTPTST